jgi:REase_MTES_1575
MRAMLLKAMSDRGGVITRTEALRIVEHHILDRAVSGRAIVRVFPGTFVLADLANDVDAIDRAALAYVPGSALSHTSALRIWRVPFVAVDGRHHLSVAPRAQVRDRDRLVVHRRDGFGVSSPPTMSRHGKRVTRLEWAIIDSWPLLAAGEQRGPAIAAVSGGQTTGARLLSALSRIDRPAGAASMRALFPLLSLGCRSELELWGHDHLFADPALPRVALQHVVETPAGTFILDRAHLAEQVGVELDGAAWHGSSEQRERDVRRDAALATIGWLIVRFTHCRLRDDPTGCRAQLHAVLERRRRQLRIS